ncbi:hypothetical protein K438DRAFT_2020787 [Mycena galopus ATCC 62051]|nr:hypothetical protein K438DRAFT_2020787 [Mycena galopus ATCC 62051]
MGNTPSLFDKTPQEHAEAAARYLETQREIAIWPPEPIVRPGHVRVQFYAYRYKVRDGWRPDIETVVPLERFGELSLFSVRRLWGLETSSIIDPLELKLGFTADPNWLSAAAVTELVAKHGCIKITEPYASYETLIKRQLRHIALSATSAFHSWSILAMSGARQDYHTVVTRLSQPYHIGKTCYTIDWTRVAVLLALLFFILVGKDVYLRILRLGDTVVDGVAASPGLTLGFWAYLATLFVVDAAAHAEIEEKEEKVMFVLAA